MNTQQFMQQLDETIARYDLLCHPFYKAWAAGELTREDLREYACDYYHYVEAFPTYLAELGIRLDDGDLRRCVLANMADEKGFEDGADQAAQPHAELWLDFAEAMGARRDRRGHEPIAEVKSLMRFFHDVASEGTPEEALATFYAYESQVPRVAREKARGLREMYGADDQACGYFTLHETADIYHSNAWRSQLVKHVGANPEAAHKALTAAENAAKALWRALDGIEERRMAAAAA
jgi:pyrroloquinoline-quinone synthase